MNFLKFINVPVFLISLALGLFAVYIFSPENKKIIVYPTHENADILQYRDKAGNCFSIDEKETTCPADSNRLSILPFQS